MDEYDVKARNKGKGNSVFIISLVIVAAIAIWGIISPKSMGKVGDSVFVALTKNFGWLYLMAMFLFVVFMLYLAFSKYGSIRLGKDTDRPEHKNISWFAMLFSAGMGIGLVFYSVAEPLNHYINPDGMAGGTAEAADFAMFASFFHWGLHPWVSYCVIALPLAYMQYRKNKPGLISSIFIPLLGEKRVNGPIGKTIDILAIFATVAGVATSLGLGVMQINSGLNYVFGIPDNLTVQVIITIVLTIIFVGTAVAGIEKGISKLSDMNVVICAVLMIIVLIVGPTVTILNGFTNGMGQYISGLISESLRISTFGDNGWIEGWRIFYWAWWIAWAPFVGMFIARISKGRTIREFIVGVTMIPALGSCLWFAIFGATSIDLGPELAKKAIEKTETAYFVVMEQMPLGTIISVITIVLLCTFFTTSANSATFVLGMLSSKGDLNPSTGMKIIWGVLQAAIALALMFAGGLNMLQTISIVAAFPFAFVMIAGCVSLLKALGKEKPKELPAKPDEPVVQPKAAT